MKKRDSRIDFLRFIGFSLIILAHVGAPYNLTQFRCFDVPLMLFVSGLSSSEKNICNYFVFIWKRTKRLIIPVWLFLCVYLSFFYIIQFIVLPEQYLTGEMILRSFLLLDKSIGYVWIFRVFLIVMLLTPLLLRICNAIQNIYIFSLVLICFGCILFLFNCYSFLLKVESFLTIFFRDYIQYGVAYSIPFIIGTKAKTLNRREESVLLLVLVVVCFVLFYFYSQKHSFPQGISSEYKYPPHIFYIAYGVLISFLLWFFRNIWQKLSNYKFPLFVGQNTMWIYLWHMPFALISTIFIHNWFLSYFFVYSFGVLCFCIQNKIINYLPNKNIVKYLKG